MAVAQLFEGTEKPRQLLYQVNPELQHPQIPAEVAAVAIASADPFKSSGCIGTIKTESYQRRLSPDLTYSDRPTIPLERSSHMRVSSELYGIEHSFEMVRTSYGILPVPFAKRAIRRAAQRQADFATWKARELILSQR